MPPRHARSPLAAVLLRRIAAMLGLEKVVRDTLNLPSRCMAYELYLEPLMVPGRQRDQISLKATLWVDRDSLGLGVRETALGLDVEAGMGDRAVEPSTRPMAPMPSQWLQHAPSPQKGRPPNAE